MGKRKASSSATNSRSKQAKIHSATTSQRDSVGSGNESDSSVSGKSHGSKVKGDASDDEGSEAELGTW
jgi:hypothetical protein